MILYKYLDPPRIDILQNKLIRFTQPKFLNDLHEALPAFHQIITNEGFDFHLKDQITEVNKINIENILNKEAPYLTQDQIKQIAINPSIQNLVTDIYPQIVDFVKIGRAHV